MKFVIATHNKGKLVEFQRLLEPMGIEAVTMDISEPEEDGASFAENAYIKAAAACKETGLPAVADDSGLCVDCLKGAPGVYSARYGGEGVDDAGRYRLLLENMRGQMTRAAKFVGVITCCFPNGDVLSARGECPGTIAYAPMGEGGFGYDPVFFVPELKKTFAQLTPSEKNAVSHRGKAIRMFKSELEKYLGHE